MGVFMESIKPVLLYISHNFDLVLGIVCFVLFYCSIKKCFWKGDKSRVKLFLLSMLSYPPVILAVILNPASKITEQIQESIFSSGNDVEKMVVQCLIILIATLISLILILLISRLMGKWLGTPNRSLVTYVYMMNVIFIIMAIRGEIKSNGDSWFVDAIVNILGIVVLIVAVVLVYCFVIKELSFLTDKERKINTRLFTVPPMLFILGFTVYSSTVAGRLGREGRYLVLLFTNIILLLFIWAFYIIIKNINATNEAIDAKELAAELARQEARIEADLEIAQSIQSSALPSVFPPFSERKEFELFASMHAAKEVGGDFYDYYMLDENTLGFLIADVSGKSIPGAMFMMTSKTVIKSLAESGMPVDEVFMEANEKLCEGNDAEMFLTAWMGYLDLKTGLVKVANAGHNPPVLIRDGKAEYVILKPGLMLAGMDGMMYKEQEVQLQKGDILYLYTDGVTEAMDAEENLYGEDRLLEILSFGNDYPAPSGENGIAGAVCEVVSADIERFVQGAEQSDDITMLCVRYLG